MNQHALGAMSQVDSTQPFLQCCAEGISNLCQKNAEVIVLRVDPTKCTADGPGTNVAEVDTSVRTVYQNGQLCRETVETELK